MRYSKHYTSVLAIMIIILILLNYLTAFSQESNDTIKSVRATLQLHANTRNAKIDTIVFDHYLSAGTQLKIKEFVTINLKGSYERDNGLMYWGYMGDAVWKYGQAGYIFDTEKNVNLLYVTAYYPVIKIFKIGYDFSVNFNQSNICYHSIYAGVKWEWISAEIAFFDKLHRIKYSLIPTIKRWDRLSLGIKVEGLYVSDKFKWSNGLTLNYKVN